MKKQKTSFFNLHLTSNISISLVLFMVGLITYLLIITTDFAHRSQENIAVSVMLDDSISNEQRSRLERYITDARYVKTFTYISKDSALNSIVDMLGEDPTTILGLNPVSASYEVYLNQHYANVDSIQSVVIPKLKDFQGITDITYEQDLVDLLNNNINRLLILFSAIVIVLLFISMVLINNTIRLTIYSKRFLINTMRLVGAKNHFIRSPFLKRSMVNAAIGAVLGFILLVGAIYMMQVQINGYSNLETLYNPKIVLPVAGVMIAVSIIINFFATISAVNRYLRMSTDKLYFV